MSAAAAGRFCMISFCVMFLLLGMYFVIYVVFISYLEVNVHLTGIVFNWWG